MNLDSQKSAQPCGCDEGAKWVCEQHRGTSRIVSHETMGEIIVVTPTEGIQTQTVIHKDAQTDIAFSDASETVDARKVGIGGAPTRCTTLPTGASERKAYPIASGFFDYFPDAIAAVANISYRGNTQHNPGKPIHWNRKVSGDEADTLGRHFLQRGTFDIDGVRHSAKLAWRAMALLQKEIENDANQ